MREKEKPPLLKVHHPNNNPMHSPHTFIFFTARQAAEIWTQTQVDIHTRMKEP